MAKKYITTTLPYVNSDPHIGAAYEFVQADSIARYWRLMGHEVFFNTGTDEHGQKIAQKADEKGQSRQEYVDHYAGEFEKLREALNLSYDNFIRTTDKSHIEAAQELWRRCDANGDIEKRTFKGLYCVGCEMFLRDNDLVDGKCPNHPGQEPEEVEEENYFFKLSNYGAQLCEYLEKGQSVIPDWQQKWAIDFVKSGLEDFSISRKKDRMDWGVPVPGDDEHVMYVWFDALTNYISTLGWPNEEGKFAEFWKDGEVLQVAGKDQVRFQSIMWQAMLMSAGVKTSDSVLYHGFITVDGQKMSKSIGNVISPYELVEKYGTGATRYLLLRHVHPFEDTDITWERLDEWYTAHLVNGLGNLVARVMKMAETHLDEPVYTDCVDKEGWNDPRKTDTRAHFDAYEISSVLDLVWKHISETDELIQEKEPFKLVKEDKKAAQEVIIELVKRLAVVAFHLTPFMPLTAVVIKEAIKENKKPENLFSRLES